MPFTTSTGFTVEPTGRQAVPSFPAEADLFDHGDLCVCLEHLLDDGVQAMILDLAGGRPVRR